MTFQSIKCYIVQWAPTLCFILPDIPPRGVVLHLSLDLFCLFYSPRANQCLQPFSTFLFTLYEYTLGPIGTSYTTTYLSNEPKCSVLSYLTGLSERSHFQYLSLGSICLCCPPRAHPCFQLSPRSFILLTGYTLEPTYWDLLEYHVSPQQARRSTVLSLGGASLRGEISYLSWEYFVSVDPPLAHQCVQLPSTLFYISLYAN